LFFNELGIADNRWNKEANIHGFRFAVKTMLILLVIYSFRNRWG
jgi:hypothetical protein